MTVTKADEIFRSWRAGLLAQQEFPSGGLWHYSSGQGLLGILQSRRLWATDVRFLNDASEYSYGVGVCLDALREFRATYADDSSAADLLDGLFLKDEVVPRWLEKSTTFVACFCESGDLLSQWRAYNGGGPQVGYALRFNPRTPPGWAQTARQESGGSRLRKIVYEPDAQRTLAREVFAPLVAELGEASRQDDATAEVARNLVNALHEVAGFCKDPTFEEEQEWRISFTQILEDPSDIQFRSGISGLVVPYVELDVEEQTGATAGRLPIDCVRVGPSPEPSLSQSGVAALLRSTGRSDVTVLGSSAPLRL